MSTSGNREFWGCIGAIGAAIIAGICTLVVATPTLLPFFAGLVVAPTPTRFTNSAALPVTNPTNSLASKCEWLRNNFPQTEQAIRAKYGIPRSSNVFFHIEECAPVVNGFYFRGTEVIELKVPEGGCLDSSRTAIFSGPTIPESYGGLRAYSGTVRDSNISYRAALCEYHP